jgi:predicted PurR-regulated permease PerM
MRLLAYVLLLVGLAYFLYLIRTVLVPFLLAGALTYILEPPVRALERRRFGRTPAILTVYAVLAGAVGLCTVFLLPLVLDELNRLTEVIPEYTVRVREFTSHLQSDYSRISMPDNIRRVLDEAIAGTEARLLAAIRDLVTGIFGFFGSVLRVLIAPVLAFYMLRDLDGFKSWLRALLPEPTQREWLQCLRQIDGVVGGFIRAQVLIALVVGALTALALQLLGLRFAVLLGIIAALGELIPYFGPIVAAAPAVLVGFLTSPLRALQVLLVVTLIQQLESTVVGPKLIGDRTGLHPLVVIFAVLAGGYLFGPWGLLLAVPIGAVLRVLLLQLLARSGRR